MTKTVRVDRDELNALLDLRDNGYERLRIDNLRLVEYREQVLAINRDQCARLAHQDLELTAARDRNIRLHKRVLELEADLAKHAPTAVSITQPLFSRQELVG